MSRIDPQQFIQVLDSLQRAYNFELDPAHVSGVCREGMYHAATRFIDQKIDVGRMGYSEEVGDLVYQLVKLFAVKDDVLTPENQRRLFDAHGQDMRPGETQLSLGEMYSLAYGFVDEFRAGRLMSGMQAGDSFPDQQRIAEDFLANQYVSYVTRKSTGNSDADGFQTLEFIRERKVPEEVGELVEVLLFQNLPGCCQRSLDSMSGNLHKARDVVYDVQSAVARYDSMVFKNLDELLKSETSTDLSLGDVLDFTLLKIRGRQELQFRGFEQRTLRDACKVVEYFLEADMVMNGTRYALSRDT